ncbi:hypothetical protein CPB86DRAFT_779301 [Serendipita vermifera]|nr:hypothetical protein CPB86DRAFT_779301 [Serendipita vermifera]
MDVYAAPNIEEPLISYNPLGIPDYPVSIPAVSSNDGAFYNHSDFTNLAISGVHNAGSGTLSAMQFPDHYLSHLGNTGHAAPHNDAAPHNGVTPIRRFQCTICLRWFSRRCRMDACQNSHTNSRPHVCNGLCGEALW